MSGRSVLAPSTRTIERDLVIQRNRVRRRQPREAGFTLIELLVVIIILGILSAVVVFAVRGAGDKGKASAVKIDKRTLETAQEACLLYTSPSPRDS